MSVFVLLSVIPTQLKAEPEKSVVTAVSSKNTEAMNAEALQIADAALETSQMARLEEIKTMDKSELTAADKKELRAEVHSIQRDEDRRDRDNHRGDYDGGRHHRHGGVFVFGGGGLLLIILILLLL
jgi:predicted Mrr-cat superfamily restriction endonuclease